MELVFTIEIHLHVFTKAAGLQHAKLLITYHKKSFHWNFLKVLEQIFTDVVVRSCSPK